MYKLYVKSETSFDGRKLVGEFKDSDKAYEKIEEELAKDENIKYILEETTGKVDIYGDLIVDVIDEN